MKLSRDLLLNPVNFEDLADLSGLSMCPATIQELLSKSLEIRVTVVGDRVMSAAIDSQVSARATHDWRRDGVRMLQGWRTYQLPVEVEEKVLRLMDYFSLNYGAIDIILTPDGRHVFLEINPAANFSGSNALRVCPSPRLSQTFSSDTHHGVNPVLRFFVGKT